MKATEGSWWNTLSNTALIYYTNKLVFPSITKAGFLKGAPKFAFGKTVTQVGKEYQVLFEPGKKLAEGQFVKQKINLVNAIKSLGKPGTYGKVGLNYFKANVMEGLQEVTQDVLQETWQNYYVNTFDNPDARNFRYGTGLVADAIKKQWSAQGLEVFLSGFLMGTILQAPGKIKTYATIGYNDYFRNDSKFNDYVSNRETMADDIVNELNTLYKNADLFFDPRIASYAQQGLISKVIDNPEDHTQKEIKDTEFAAFQSAMFASLERGTFDMFLKHYEGYQSASAQEIEEAWNLEPGQGEKALEGFGKMLDHARKTSNRYNSVKNKMKDFRINLDDYEKDTYEYRLAKVYNKAYNQAILSHVFLHDSFDDNTRRINKLYQKLSNLTALSETPIINITALTDPNQLMREVEHLKLEIEGLQSVTTIEAVEELSRKRELLEHYTRFQESLEKVTETMVSKDMMNQLITQIEEEDIEEGEKKSTVESIGGIVESIEKGETNQFTKFKEDLENLLVNLGATNELRLKVKNEIENQGGIDIIFDDLIDILGLKGESARLNEFVNLLASPNGFYQHVVRNFKYMKDLYNNREEIVKDIVNQEISAIEKNTLLNALAEQGIYVDLEEFAEWVENPTKFPEQFIDITTNAIIPKGSLLYEEYIGAFINAARLDAKKPAGENLSEKEVLDQRVKELEEEAQKLIEIEREKYVKEFKSKYGRTPSEVELQQEEDSKSQKIDLKRKKELETEKKDLNDAIEALADTNDYLKIRAASEVIMEVMQKLGLDPVQFYNDRFQTILADPTQKAIIADAKDLIDVSDLATDEEKLQVAVSAAGNAYIFTQWGTNRIEEIDVELNKQTAKPEIDIENTKEYLQFQERVDAIEEKYAKLIEDLKVEFEKKGVTEDTVIEYSTKTPFENFDSQSQKEITEAFDVYLEEVLQESLDIKNTKPIEYERLRGNWLETQSDLINSLNEKNQQRALDKAERLSKPPQLKFIDIKIGADKSTYEISSLIKRFQKFLDQGWYPNPQKPGEKISLTPTLIQNLKDDIAALNGYLNARVQAAGPRNIAEETVNIIEDNVIAKQDELVIIYNEETGEVIGRKFKDSEPGDPMPDRTTQVAEEVENTISGEDPFEYHAIKEKTDKETGETIKAPLENLYNQFFNDPEIAEEDKIRLFMEAFKKKVFQGGWKAFKYQPKLDAIEASLSQGSYEALKETIRRFAFKESADAGNVVDDLIRMFLTPNANTKSNFTEFSYDSEVLIKGATTKISDVMSKKAFDALFAPVSATSPGGIVTKFRLGVVDGSYTILSENVKLFDRSFRDGKGVTGELDLLLVKEDGTVAIVDIKTSALKRNNKGELISKWKNFGTGKGYEKSTYFRAQQSIYGYMFFNSTGIMPELKLMPFDIILNDDKMGYIEDISLPGIVPAGKDTIDLEYLPEIENHGIQKVQPTDVKIREKAATKIDIKQGIQQSDPKVNTLSGNLNKPIVYEGRVGKLVRMSNGNFGIEIVKNNDLTTLQLSLDSFKANLLVEQSLGERGNVDLTLELEEQINKLENAIKSQKGVTEIRPITRLGIELGNGNLTLDYAGVQMILPIDSVGQIAEIDGELIDASFSNQEETIASINGVKFNVNRDANGHIISLDYMSNDKEISNLDNQYGEISDKINRLRTTLQKEDLDPNAVDPLIIQINDLQVEQKRLNAKKLRLKQTSKKIYLYGQNVDNYIFALNQLPNSFQKTNKKSTKLDEIQDLKLIDSLSLSSAISQAITAIMEEDYPAALDKLLFGNVEAISGADMVGISIWIRETVERLNELGYSVINRGDLVDDIQNQIDALNRLNSDIQLIKLKKDGKIQNYKQVGKIFPKGSEVQERSDVSSDTRNESGQKKTDTRSSSTEELKSIVKRSRQRVDPELKPEPTLPKKVVEAISKIEKANPLNIRDVYQKAFLNLVKEGLSTREITKAKNKRLEELKVLSLDTIAVKEYLVVKKSDNDLVADEIYQVVRLNKNSVRLKNNLTKKEETFKEDMLKEMFKKVEDESTSETTPITPVDIEGSNESMDAVKKASNDQSIIDDAKKVASESSTSDLMNILGKNSKKC
jgi:hypothetical protein